MSEGTDDPEVKWQQGVDPALQRYWYDDGMQPDPSGEWVRYADVRALFTREDVALLDRCRAVIGWQHEEAVDALAKRIAALLPPE